MAGALRRWCVRALDDAGAPLWCGGRRPLPATNRRKVIVAIHIGSRPHADYHNRFGYREERVSGPRHRCGREGRHQEAASPRSGVEVFCGAAAPCLIGIEACATAHYWARELTKLGHEVRLMPAKEVKAYVKRNKK